MPLDTSLSSVQDELVARNPDFAVDISRRSSVWAILVVVGISMSFRRAGMGTASSDMG